jgi:hypothetical protein
LVWESLTRRGEEAGADHPDNVSATSNGFRSPDPSPQPRITSIVTMPARYGQIAKV